MGFDDVDELGSLLRGLGRIDRSQDPTILLGNQQVRGHEGMGHDPSAQFIFEEMQRSGSVLGGEPSGHVIFPDFKLSGDGLLTTLKIAEVITSDRASFDELVRDWVEAPQLLKNIRVREKVPLETLPTIQAKMTEIHHELQGCGRLVVRYSGTEPLLRVMIESDDSARNDRLMEQLLKAIHDVIG